jgi:hypothetical protein
VQNKTLHHYFVCNNVPGQKLLLQANTDADLEIYSEKDLGAHHQNTTEL